MKRNTLRLLAMVVAFFIGVSINNSCGESKNDGSTSVQELWNAIHALQAEIETLKPTGETQIDGLYFSRAGFASSKVKKYIQSIQDMTYEEEYIYDNKGRLLQRINYNYNSGMKSTTTYEYSGKKVIQTTVVTYDNSPAFNGTSQIVTEYY